MKDIQNRMHVYTFDTDHGYCKEMARENMSCVLISCQLIYIAKTKGDYLCLCFRICKTQFSYDAVHILKGNFPRERRLQVKLNRLLYQFEPPHEKTNVLHMRKQRRRSAIGIGVFDFAAQIVQSLYFRKPKVQACSHLLWLYSPVCVGPGWKPQRQVFS